MRACADEVLMGLFGSENSNLMICEMYQRLCAMRMNAL